MKPLQKHRSDPTLATRRTRGSSETVARPATELSSDPTPSSHQAPSDHPQIAQLDLCNDRDCKSIPRLNHYPPSAGASTRVCQL